MESRKIDLDSRASEAGFRNFMSFAFVHYYGSKKTIKICASIIDVSPSTMRNGLILRCWPIRSPSQAQTHVTRGAPKKKRMVDVWGRIRENTPYIFPWCALHVYYEKYSLTAYEIAPIIKISAPLIYKLLRKYGIKVRKPGGAIHERSS